MDQQNATTVLRTLEQRHVAPMGEQALDVEQAAARGAASPEPVLLLTNAALYARAASAKDWSRLPLDRIRKVNVSQDPSGMLTRYRVEDDGGEVRYDVALPMARASFRDRMARLDADRAAAPVAACVAAPPAPVVTVARAAGLPTSPAPSYVPAAAPRRFVLASSTGWPAVQVA